MKEEEWHKKLEPHPPLVASRIIQFRISRLPLLVAPPIGLFLVVLWMLRFMAAKLTPHARREKMKLHNQNTVARSVTSGAVIHAKDL